MNLELDRTWAMTDDVSQAWENGGTEMYRTQRKDISLQHLLSCRSLTVLPLKDFTYGFSMNVNYLREVLGALMDLGSLPWLCFRRLNFWTDIKSNTADTQTRER